MVNNHDKICLVFVIRHLEILTLDRDQDDND